MRADFVVIFYLGFVVLSDYGIYPSSILPYIQSLIESEDRATFVYSVVLSSNATAQVLVSFVCGYASKLIGMKAVFIILQLVALLGTAIYAMAGYPIGSAWAILIGRTLAGIGVGVYALGLSYISVASLDGTHRASNIANFRTLATFSIIPASFVPIIISLPFISFSIGPYDVNEYTYPAILTFIMQAIGLVAMVKLYQNPEAISVKEDDINSNDALLSGENKPKQPKKPEPPPVQEGKKNFYISPGVVLVLSIFGFQGYLVATIMYVMPVIMLDKYEWPLVIYTPVLFVISVLALVGTVLGKITDKRLGYWRHMAIVPTMGAISLSTVIAAVGSTGPDVIYAPIGATLFLSAVGLMYCMYQLQQTILATVYSQILPREFLVRMMPLTSALYGIGKIIAPLISEAQAAAFGYPLIFYVFLVVSAALMFISIALNRHFLPRKLPKLTSNTSEAEPLTQDSEKISSDSDDDVEKNVS